MFCVVTHAPLFNSKFQYFIWLVISLWGSINGGSASIIIVEDIVEEGGDEITAGYIPVISIGNCQKFECITANGVNGLETTCDRNNVAETGLGGHNSVS